MHPSCNRWKPSDAEVIPSGAYTEALGAEEYHQHPPIHTVAVIVDSRHPNTSVIATVMVDSRHPNTSVIATGNNLTIGWFPRIAAKLHQVPDWSALGNDVGNNL